MHRNALYMASGIVLLTSGFFTPTTYSDEPVATTDSQQTEGVIRFEVSGSYKVVIDGKLVAWGQGTTNLELDRSQLARVLRDLQTTIGDLQVSLRDSKLIGDDVIDTITSLPSTIRSTNETLRMLSDPKTQEALRQVESMLRLLPRTTAPMVLPSDSDSDQD